MHLMERKIFLTGVAPLGALSNRFNFIICNSEHCDIKSEEEEETFTNGNAVRLIPIIDNYGCWGQFLSTFPDPVSLR